MPELYPLQIGTVFRTKDRRPDAYQFCLAEEVGDGESKDT